MLNFLRVFVALLALAGNADAYRKGGVQPGGTSFMNLSPYDLNQATLVNVIKVTSYTFSTLTDMLKVDANGFLISGPANLVSFDFPGGIQVTPSAQYTVSWEDLRFSSLYIGVPVTGCSASGATITGCGGGVSLTIETTASTGSVTFTPAPGSGFSLTWFDAGGTWSVGANPKIGMYRTSDAARYAAGVVFTSEYEDKLVGLLLRGIRPMGFVNRFGANVNMETNWGYRNTLSTINWGPRFVPGAMAGGGSAAISGTNTYTAAATPDTGGSYVDGMQVIGIVANANTSTTPTLNVGGLGAKTILGPFFAYPLGVGEIQTGLASFTYKAVLDKFIFNGNGAITPGLPIEAQIQLANRLNYQLWTVLPFLATDSYLTSWATAVRDNLSSSLYFYPEYSNEDWNQQFRQQWFADAMGVAFGFTTGDEAIYAWQGLRTKQMMATMATVFGGSLSARVRGIIGVQVGGNNLSIEPNLLNGQKLSPSIGNQAYCEYTGGVWSGSCTGGANYTAFPNRPIDSVQGIAVAPYAGGTNLCLGPDLGCTPTADNAPFYQSLVTAWEAGQSATAIALVDADIRNGRVLVQNVTCSGTTFTTPLAHGFTNTQNAIFQVTGGTIYSGITAGRMYQINSASGTTFKVRPYDRNIVTGVDLNCGSAGSGTMNVGEVGGSSRSMTYVTGLWYPTWESVASDYDAARSGGGLPALRVEWYEGNLEPVGPSAGQCTSLGITGSDCAGSIAASILAWKNSSSARSTQTAYYKWFMGTDAAQALTFGLMAHSKSTSNLVVLQPGPTCTDDPWAVMPSCLPTATPFQTYNGIYDFNQNFLLKRDMQTPEGANDNSPMFLEKAA